MNCWGPRSWKQQILTTLFGFHQAHDLLRNHPLDCPTWSNKIWGLDANYSIPLAKRVQILYLPQSTCFFHFCTLFLFVSHGMQLLSPFHSEDFWLSQLAGRISNIKHLAILGSMYTSWTIPCKGRKKNEALYGASKCRNLLSSTPLKINMNLQITQLKGKSSSKPPFWVPC